MLHRTFLCLPPLLLLLLTRSFAFLASGSLSLSSSRQSIVTEYMDEFAWPAELPVPGRRGKRSGMGMDHVGRLLAGKRAEKPDRYNETYVIVWPGSHVSMSCSL